MVTEAMRISLPDRVDAELRDALKSLDLGFCDGKVSVEVLSQWKHLVIEKSNEFFRGKSIAPFSSLSRPTLGANRRARSGPCHHNQGC